MNAPAPPPQQSDGSLIGLIGKAAAAILVATVLLWEGTEYVPYRDVIGVMTVCTGDTYDVTPGKVYTKAECEARLERQLIAHAKPVLKCTPSLKDKPNALAASISLAYNVGVGRWIGIEAERKLPKRDAALDGWRGGYCGSTAAVRFRADKLASGCDAFLAWNKAGKREIRGLTNRRKAERLICLRDA